MKSSIVCVSVCVLPFGWAGVAAAQATPPAKNSSADEGVLTEIVVTAERRHTDLQKTPIAASVLTGDDLVNKGVLTVDQLQFAMPAATVNNFGQGIDFNIRGIGKAEHNTQTTTGVITYRDGVATFPGYLQEEPYYDIASVEVLRGPQGTFVGQNATGGAVFVTSQDPKINGGNHGYFAGQVGNYSDAALQGAVNLPISDTLAARFSFNGERRDSFYDIKGSNFGNPGNIRTASGRIGLLWEPTTALSVLFKTDYSYIDLGAYPADPVLSKNDPFEIGANSQQLARDRLLRSVLKIDYVFANGTTLRSVSGYQDGTSAYRADLDGTNVGMNTFRDSVDETIYSQEFNLISPDTGRLTWIVGAYYQHDLHDFPAGQFVIGIPPGFVEYRLQGTNPVVNKAVFGQVGFDIGGGFQVQAGARYSDSSTSNDVTINQYGLPLVDKQKASASKATGKFALNWTVDPHNFLYAFVATGFRPGGLNVPVGLGLPAPFEPEEVTEYEIGWKASWADGHLRTQVDAYHNDYKNFQVIVGYPTIPVFGIELNNPNPTTIYGFEGQLEAVFGQFSMDAGTGWLKSKLGKFFATDPRVASLLPCNPQTGPASASCINLDGHEQTYAPNFTFNVGMQYAFGLGGGDTLTPRINYGHIASQWATLFENEARGDRVEERNILTAQAAWTRANGLVVTLYGTNITDQHYVGAVNSGLRFVGPPRQFGLRVMKVF
jgi:iron complex outermembrane receptor protein